MADNIVLIGFMAVGKGRTARQLSRRTGLYTVDTDDLIESKVKESIKGIFDQQGEDAFRVLERQTARWLERSVRGTIVSTGGGFFKVPNLKGIGTVIFLDASLESILECIHAHPDAEGKIRKRPLLGDMAGARRLYKERLPQYREAADLVVKVKQGDVKGAVEKIITALDLPRLND
jgi:shikimate kinase